MQGTIKTVKTDRGFGFIEPSDGGKDIFFHMRDLDGLDFSERLQELRVEFTVVSTDKGPRATRIHAASR